MDKLPIVVLEERHTSPVLVTLIQSQHLWRIALAVRLDRERKMVQSSECFFFTATAWNKQNTTMTVVNITQATLARLCFS